MDPTQPPARNYVTIPVTLGNRQISATLEAQDEADARATFERLRPDFEAKNPNATAAFGMRGPTGAYGLAADASDEASALAQLQPGFDRQQAVAQFTADNEEFEQTARFIWGSTEIERLTRDFNAMDAADAALKGAGAVAGDVTKGLLTAPVQVVSGLAEGGNEILDTIQAAGTALSDAANVPMPYMQIGGDAGGVRFGIAPPGQFSAVAREAGIDPNAAPDILPELASDPDTVTGGLFRTLGQFAAGLGVAGKALQGWRAASTIGRGAKALTAGAMADFSAFDEADDRLSDLIQSVPELRNPVTEWLAGDEDDAALEGRLKNAIEGGILGVGFEAVEPLVRTLSAYRKMKAVQPQVLSESQKIMAEQIARDERLAGEIKTADDVLGGDAPLVEVAPAPRSTAGMDGSQLEAEGLTRTADAAGGTPQRPQDVGQAAREGDAAPDFGANPFKINFARIGSPDDIKSVVAQMVESAPDAIDAARRGVQTWDASRAGATEILKEKEAFDALMSRRVGQAASDQEITAYRMLWASSGNKLREVARMAADAPTEANLLAYRKMLMTHGAITEQVMGARAEAGRALQVFRMQGLPSQEAARRVREMVNGASGDLREALLDSARAMADMTPDEMAEAARKIAPMSDAQRVRTIIQAAMLTNPSTHVANITGNGMALLFETAVRAAAPALRAGAEGAVKEGEAVAMFAGMQRAFFDMIRRAPRFREFISAQSQIGGKAEAEHQHLFPKSAASQSPQVRAVANAANAIIQVPGRLTAGMDNIFKFIGTDAAINAAAFRQAAREVEEGAITQADAVRRQRELVADPTPAMLDEAAQFTEEATFTRSQEMWPSASGGTSSPGMGRTLLNLRQVMERGGPVGGYVSGVIMPFVNTPANLISYALRSGPLAPIMNRYKEDIAAGGARAEIAKTRAIVGSMALWTAFGLATEGHITGGGPLDPQQRQLLMRQGWQPYSIRIGDTWYAYNRLDPLGTVLSVASDLADISYGTDWDDWESTDQFSEIVGAAAGGVGMAITNKTMLTGMTDLFEWMSDPRRYGEQFLSSRLVAPLPSVVGLAERLGDPFQREPMVEPRPPGGVNDALSAVESMLVQAKTRIPGLSSTQPIKRDLWGRPVMHVSGLGPWYEILSPSRASHSRYEPIDGELARLRHYPTMPRREMIVPPDLRSGPDDDGRRNLSDRPDIYNRILEVRGEMILDRLNKMVSGEGSEGAVYQGATNDQQIDMIDEIISEAGKAARAQVIEEFYADFSDMARRRADARNMPMPEMVE